MTASMILFACSRVFRIRMSPFIVVVIVVVVAVVVCGFPACLTCFARIPP